MTDLKDARLALTSKIRAQQAGRGLDLVASHTNTVIMYQAIAHALCYLAQHHGVSHDTLCARLRGEKTASVSSLTYSKKLGLRLQQSLGLARSPEHERKRINRALDSVYACLQGVSMEHVFTLLVPWLVKLAPQLGLPADVMITRIENLDALTRFSGSPKRHIPEDQYGL